MVIGSVVGWLREGMQVLVLTDGEALDVAELV